MLLLLHPAPRASLHPARPALPPLGRLPLLRRRRRRPSHPAPAPGPDCRAPAIGFSPQLSGAGHHSPARPELPPPRRRLPPLRRRHRHPARPAPAPGPDCLAPAIGFSPRLSSAGLRSPARLALPPPPPPLPCVCPAPRLRGLQERHLLPQERPRQPCPRSQRPRRRLSTPSQPCCFRSSPLRPFRCGSAAVPSGVMVCVWSNQFGVFFPGTLANLQNWRVPTRLNLRALSRPRCRGGAAFGSRSPQLGYSLGSSTSTRIVPVEGLETTPKSQVR